MNSEIHHSAYRATKIVATIGPASHRVETLMQMINAGVDVIRINFSHGTTDDHKTWAANIRQAALACKREIAIMGDLQGPKIRIGKFVHGKIELRAGQPFILDAAAQALGDEHRVGLDYPNLPNDVKTGDALLLNDGLIELTVSQVKGSEIHTIVKIGGELSNNKGINRRGGGLTAPALTEKDKADIEVAIAIGIDYLAVSFPKSAQDMQTARQLADTAGAKHGIRVKLIAKIERLEATAINTLKEILHVSDGVMVARGDLAVEVGNASVPALQKRIIRMAHDANKLVITATQMMESMIIHPLPTRAEVSDVANAVLDGTDAVMLSAETAAGKHPVETVTYMAAICVEAEKSEVVHLDTDFLDKKFQRIDQSIAYGALFTAHHLGAKAIVALTDSGSTALWMSRHPIHVPIYALTNNIATQRAMCLFRNVVPLYIQTTDDRDIALHEAENLLLTHSIVASGDAIVLTIGEPMGKPGGTNTLKIVHVGQHSSRSS